MKDAMGNEIAVGDFVVMGHREYASLVFGRIVEITKNKVRVKWDVTPEGYGYDPYSMLKEPGNVCKIDGPEATAYCLRKRI